MNDVAHTFAFEALRNGKLGISPAYGSFLAEAASYCLELKGHPNPVLLRVTGDLPRTGNLRWCASAANLETTYADLQETTEYGAYGVAFVVAVEVTGFSYIERSAKGTGIDCWLSEGHHQHGPFQRAARMEVSGILDGDESAITGRLHKKLAQTEKSDETWLPAYVAIVEFGSPVVSLVKKNGKKK
jgi:hypothetical protein